MNTVELVQMCKKEDVDEIGVVTKHEFEPDPYGDCDESKKTYVVCGKKDDVIKLTNLGYDAVETYIAETEIKEFVSKDHTNDEIRDYIMNSGNHAILTTLQDEKVVSYSDNLLNNDETSYESQLLINLSEYNRFKERIKSNEFRFAYEKDGFEA